MKTKQTTELVSFEVGDIIEWKGIEGQYFIICYDGWGYKLLWFEHGSFYTSYKTVETIHSEYRAGRITFVGHTYNQIDYDVDMKKQLSDDCQQAGDCQDMHNDDSTPCTDSDWG